MISPSPQQANSIHQLRGTLVHEFLVAAFDDARNHLELSDGNALYRLQGSVTTLRALLNAIEKSG